MKLINDIEISYFRSYYKFRIKDVRDLSIIFGKNDSGKSNVVRALNLFFSGRPERFYPFDFDIDFCEQRLEEARTSENMRKFLYVKITFNTPSSYIKSLGESFYVKKQWSVSGDFTETISSGIPKSKHHIAKRLLNKIKFIHIPAIKDLSIFEMLLADIHETVSSSSGFHSAVFDFSTRLQDMTSEMFDSLPSEVSSSTKIGAPNQLSQLFQALDFETMSDGELSPKSLTRQRGDGVKVRHIPELLKFISDNDKYDFHIWGFEEPENSLDFVASQAEANRMLSLSKGERVQVVMTTHSPSFYLLDDLAVAKYYVSKNSEGLSEVTQGIKLRDFDAQSALDQGFYLPSVAEAIKSVSELKSRKDEAETRANNLREELYTLTAPVVLTEGRTDVDILMCAWDKLFGGKPPFIIKSCETGGANAGSGNGGASSLARRVMAISNDHPHTIVALFDRDETGVSHYKLDRNFSEVKIDEFDVKRGIHGRSYAALLPVPDFRNDCIKALNLPIEYLFSDEDLGKVVDGKNLELQLKKMSTKVGELKIEKELENHTHFKDIKGGKLEFAQIVVPTFTAESFRAFNAVFEMINKIIEYDKNINEQI